jgi:hypothetical protein
MAEMVRPPLQVRIPRRVLLWLLVLLLGVSIAALPQYLSIKKSAQWPSVPGVMTASRMQSGVCKGMPCYHGEFAYRYRGGNTDLTGTALELGRTHWAARESWQKVLDAYPVGKAVSVYYEPRSPANSVLEPGLFGEAEMLYEMVLGMIWFFGFSFVGAFLWYRDPDPSIAELHVNPRKKL